MGRGGGGRGGGGGAGTAGLADVVSAAVAAALRAHQGGGGGPRGDGAAPYGGGGGRGGSSSRGGGGRGPGQRQQGGGGPAGARGGARGQQQRGDGGASGAARSQGDRRGGIGGMFGGGSAQRGGERWACSACEFRANFAERTVCFRCGAARGGGATSARGPNGGGDGTGPPRRPHGGGAAQADQRSRQPQRETSALGRVSQPAVPNHGLRPAAAWNGAAPIATARAAAIGADGRRPILAWAGTAPQPPPQSQPAHAPRPQPAAHSDRPLGGGGSGEAAPPTVASVDGDGFTLVANRGRGRGPAQPGQQAHQSATGAAAAAAIAGPRQRGGNAEDGEHQQAPTSSGTTAGAADDDEAIGGAEPTSEELKDAYHKAQRLVEVLVQQGLQDGDPVLETAQQQAASAKQAWEGSKPGIGVSKRLVFAEQALARARRGQAKMEQEIDDLDMQYEAERAKRVQQLHDLRATTRRREAFLAQLSRQAAEEFQGGDGDVDGQTNIAVQTIEGPIRDAVLEAHDAAPEGSELRTRLSGALGALSELSATVARTSRARWADDEADYFDMDGGDHDDGWWGHGDDAHWNSGGWTGPHGDGGHRDQAARGAADMDTGDIAVPSWYPAGGRGEDDSAGHDRANKRWRKQDEDPNGVQGRHANPAEVPSDHENAARLQAAVASAATAGAAVPAPPTPNLALEALERRRQEIWDLAQDQGAEISSDTIAQMSMEQLDRWQTEYLL